LFQLILTFLITIFQGFRAPSASDLVSQIAETLTSSVSEAANRRYTDPISSLDSDLLDMDAPNGGQSLKSSDKARMKQLVLDAVQEIMDNDLLWDELVGKLVTNPMRYSDAFEWKSVDEGRARQCLEKVGRGQGTLQRAPGLSFATSRIATTDGGYADRLFAAGQVWSIMNEETALGLFNTIESGEHIASATISGAPSPLKQVLVELLVEGVILYNALQPTE
jgi:hypothetical protein